MKAESRQQEIAISKFRIKGLRQELREEETALRKDLHRLRKERMDGQTKTDSNAAYNIDINGTLIRNVDHIQDLLTSAEILPATRINMFLWVWSNGTYTLAEVRLAGATADRTGIGITKRSPTDAINPLAGTRIAVRRALDDWMRKC